MNERINAGYTIINSTRIGDKEYVIGENKNSYMPYITWECVNGNDYFAARYFAGRAPAEKDCADRAAKERRILDIWKIYCEEV